MNYKKELLFDIWDDDELIRVPVNELNDDELYCYHKHYSDYDGVPVFEDRIPYKEVIINEIKRRIRNKKIEDLGIN